VGASGYRQVRFGLYALICVAFASATAEPAQIVDLDALRGRVVYLDFWASWCAPCRQSFPWMEEMRKAHQADGLTVIAVNVDHDRADADRFLKQLHPGFDVRFDPEGTLAQRFKVSGMPASLIIDRHGAVRFTHVGFWPAQGAVAAQEIRELLTEKP
jgi:cytochrome c biogenesis protein CcmG/thiol:disulfide interchange protein DsbE